VSSPGALPPPDITSYVDLRPFDQPDQVIVDTALAQAKLNLPGWTPNEGDIEVVMIESLALEMAEAIVAVNRLPGAVVQALLLLAGVSPDYGAPPSATATVTFGDDLGHTVPAGTRVHLRLSDGSSVTFLVEPPGLTVFPGDSTGVVSLIGDVFTARANGVGAGALLEMADPVPFVDGITLNSPVVDGRDPETDDAWRDRGVQHLSRLSDALVIPRQFQAAALERPEVAAALALDNYDPATGPDPGDNPGHITVAVLGDGGAPLSIEAKDAIRADLDTRTVGMLVVHVVDATVVTVDVATVVIPVPGSDFAVVTDNVEAALTAYLDPLGWTFGSTVYLNELISLIDRTQGVDRVVTVTIEGAAADYAITGVAALPDAGTITVTDGS